MGAPGLGLRGTRTLWVHHTPTFPPSYPNDPPIIPPSRPRAVLGCAWVARRVAQCSGDVGHLSRCNCDQGSGKFRVLATSTGRPIFHKRVSFFRARVVIGIAASLRPPAQDGRAYQTQAGIAASPSRAFGETKHCASRSSARHISSATSVFVCRGLFSVPLYRRPPHPPAPGTGAAGLV